MFEGEPAKELQAGGIVKLQLEEDLIHHTNPKLLVA